MTLDDFTDLAFRRLENPSNAALRTAVEQALNDHPEWTDEWRAVRKTHAQFAEALPAALELNTPAPTAAEASPVPWAKLQPAPSPIAARPFRRRRRPRVLWTWLAPLATAAMMVLVWTLKPSAPAPLPAPATIAQSPGLDASLANALRTPLVDLLATLQPITLRDPSATADAWIQQPFSAALAGPVTIAWIGGPADLTLRQRGQIVWQAEHATSPTPTTTLPADGIYELTISLRHDAPNVDLRTRFITIAEPPPPPTTATSDLGPFAAIVAPLTSTPARLGEAAAAWRQLTFPQKASPTGVRLGLWLGVNARQSDVWAEARNATQIPQR